MSSTRTPRNLKHRAVGSRCSTARKRSAGARLWTNETARQDPSRHSIRDDQGTTTNVLRGKMSMAKKQVGIPEFRTEAKEANWWDRHPEAATGIMKRALKSGKARRAVPLKTVTMRLPVPDIISHMGSGSNWPTTRWSFY